MTIAERNVRIYCVYFEINSIKFYRLFIVNAIWKLSKHKSRELKQVITSARVLHKQEFVYMFMFRLNWIK